MVSVVITKYEMDLLQVNYVKKAFLSQTQIGSCEFGAAERRFRLRSYHLTAIGRMHKKRIPLQQQDSTTSQVRVTLASSGRSIKHYCLVRVVSRFLHTKLPQKRGSFNSNPVQKSAKGGFQPTATVNLAGHWKTTQVLALITCRGYSKFGFLEWNYFCRVMVSWRVGKYISEGE